MNVQFKGGLILIVLVAALYYVFPTFKAYQGGVDPQTVADKVNLGLDLQGGMYLDIEVESDAAVEEIVRRTRDNLEDLLIDEQVDFIEVRQQQNSLVLEMDIGEFHPNGLQLVKVLERGQEQWYPLGYIEVINESR